MRAGPAAVRDDELPRLFELFGGRAGVVLAVSGGADSMALMLLAHRWRSAGGATPLTVATINHGLRREARDECALVCSEAARLGLACRTLAWEGTKPATGLQAAARDARHRLLARAVAEAGADAAAMAHTLDDQAETVAMRLAHGSGISGLAAMRPESEVAGIRILRPLLCIERARLRATLAEAEMGFCEDPSNLDSRYERIRVRNGLASLGSLGITADRLARLADRAARADAALDQQAGLLLAAGRVLDGAMALDARLFSEAAAETRLRVLAQAIGLVRGADAASVRLERLEQLEEALRKAAAAGAPLRRTLGGTVVSLGPRRLRISKERGRRTENGDEGVPQS